MAYRPRVVNNKRSWWGIHTDYPEVLPSKCPTLITFDSANFSIDSSCPVFSFQKVGDFPDFLDFSSTLVLFDTATTMDQAQNE